MKSQGEHVKYKYIYDELYNPSYINGAYGGVDNAGELVVHFYMERRPLPYSQSHEVIEKNELILNINKVADSNEPSDLINSRVRFIQNGIIVNLNVAKQIHLWLGEQIKGMEKLDKELKKQNESRK